MAPSIALKDLPYSGLEGGAKMVPAPDQFENGDTLLRLPLLLINSGGGTSHHLKVSRQFAALNWQDLGGEKNSRHRNVASLGRNL